MSERARPEDVFSKRSKYYVTSQAHTDPEVLARVVQLAEPHKNDICLDIGTGTGHTALALAPFVAKMIGLDITEEMLDEARDLAAKKGIANVEFRKGDAMDLPFDHGSFDIVTCRRAAHHFTDITRSLEEMHRVLRPGGRLVIDDRSVPDDDEADGAMNHLDVLHDASHVREYKAAEWDAMLIAAGFRVTEVETYRRHVPMSKFTEGLDASVAKAMHDYLGSRSIGCRSILDYQMKGGVEYIDHFFVTISARK